MGAKDGRPNTGFSFGFLTGEMRKDSSIPHFRTSRSEFRGRGESCPLQELSQDVKMQLGGDQEAGVIFLSPLLAGKLYLFEKEVSEYAHR